MFVRLWLGVCLAVLSAILTLPGCRPVEEGAPATSEASANQRLAEQRVRVDVMTKTEEINLALTPRLADLARDVSNFRLPHHHSRGLFADKVRVVDLASDPPERVDQLPGFGISIFSWPTDAEVQIARDELSLFNPLLLAVDYFDYAKFYFVANELASGDPRRMMSDVGFEARGRGVGGKVQWYHGELDVEWQNVAAADAEAEWRIDVWKLIEFGSHETSQPLFAEVLDAAVPDRATLKRARESRQQEIIRRLLADESYQPPHRYWSWESQDRHPGVAVVDIDRDGFDDVYLMDEFGPNLMLRNRGDGTFEDIAADIGLDLKDDCSCAIFADFDNDGDADAFIGRTMRPSVYMFNRDGQFVDRTEVLVQGGLPALVSSVAAADFNRDGLLDVYFSTYAAKMIEQRRNEGVEAHRLLEEFVRQPPSPEFLRLAGRWDPTRARPGPPNVLLVNRGSRFERAESADVLEGWRNTFQATWADYDDDGDVDLYVVNDFSPSQLFRNEGDGTFVDVTRETGTADIGFGMGASFGDYDNDGRQDLYKSNMFSKAGRRIAGRLGELISPEFLKMAGGNSLFRNLGEQMEKVSGLEPPALLVEKAGWSWGGQFLDVDNDGWLDVYALSGYYTPPPEVSVAFDL